MNITKEAVFRNFRALARKGKHTVKHALKMHNDKPKLLLMFCGRVIAWPGIGRELYKNEPVFKATIKKCNAYLLEIGAIDILPYFEGPQDDNYFDAEKKFVCLTAIQIALVDLIYSKGIFPDAVIGVSLGEAAALYAAGANTANEALKAIWSLAIVTVDDSNDNVVMYVFTSLKHTMVLMKQCPVKFEIMNEENDNCVFIQMQYADENKIAEFLSLNKVQFKVGARNFKAYHTSNLKKHANRINKLTANTLSHPLKYDYYSSTFSKVIPKNTIVDTTFWANMISNSSLTNSALNLALNKGFEHILQVTIPYITARHLNNKPQTDSIKLFNTSQKHLDEVNYLNNVLKKLSKHRGEAKSVQTDCSSKLFTDFLNNFDFLDLNPLSAFEYMRKHGGVHFLPKNNAWIILNYNDVEQVIKQPYLYSNEIYSDFDTVLLGAGPEQHKMTRELIQPLFSAKAINDISTAVTKKANQLADILLKKDEFDFLRDFSCSVTDAALFAFWGLDIEQIQAEESFIGADPYAPDFKECITNFFDRQLKSHYPGFENTITGKIQAMVKQQIFTHAEGVSLLRLLWTAGMYSTTTFVAIIFDILIKNPEIALQIQSDPKLINQFISESLRFKLSATFVSRISKQATVIGGVRIPADSHIILSLESANHDPECFANPHEFSLTRPTKRNFTFGAGIHQCIGMGIVRAEVTAILPVILANLDHFKEYDIHEPRYIQYPDVRIINSMVLKKKTY